VLPVMQRQRRGRIINVSSNAARFPFPRGSAYSASKAGLEGLTRTVAAEVKRDGHRDVLINAWSPGRTATRMARYGQDPAVTYRHARKLAALPANGPTGLAYHRGRPHESLGWRTRVELRRLRRNLRRHRND